MARSYCFLGGMWEEAVVEHKRQIAAHWYSQILLVVSLSVSPAPEIYQDQEEPQLQTPKAVKLLSKCFWCSAEFLLTLQDVLMFIVRRVVYVWANFLFLGTQNITKEISILAF